MALVRDGKLAVPERVPQLDRTIARPGYNLSVVGGEGDGKNIIGVPDEAARRVPSSQLPQTQRLVPGRGQSVGTV